MNRPPRSIYVTWIAFILFALVMWAQAWNTATAQELHTVNVTLSAENEPLANVRSIFYDDITGEPVAECRTDISGRCQIVLRDPTMTGNAIRGWLDFGQYGTRAVVWMGGAVDVDVHIADGRVNVAGHLDHHDHSTAPTPTVRPTFAPLAGSHEAATATAVALQTDAGPNPTPSAETLTSSTPYPTTVQSIGEDSAENSEISNPISLAARVIIIVLFVGGWALFVMRLVRINRLAEAAENDQR